MITPPPTKDEFGEIAKGATFALLAAKVSGVDEDTLGYKLTWGQVFAPLVSWLLWKALILFLFTIALGVFILGVWINKNYF